MTPTAKVYTFEEQSRDVLAKEIDGLTALATAAGQSFSVRVSKIAGWFRAEVTVYGGKP
jgi:hypothetical protein